MNHEGMEGSVIVITGGGSGMGAAMAKDFAERGAGIAILDLDDQQNRRCWRWQYRKKSQ